MYALMVILSLNGLNFINLPPESARPVLRVFNWSFAFATISALIALFESLNSRITLERDAERDRFRDMAEFAVESSIMNNSTDFLANAGDQLLASVLQQKSAIDELSATTEQLAASAMKNTDMAGAAKHAITDVEQHLLISKAAIDQLIQAITKLQHSSQEIQSINNVINDIAYQTNLLSLNAMIEASRGSDNGGFKVVALEVKKLAERSSDAAANINHLLKENFSSVKLGVELSENMRQRFVEIQEKIHPLATSVGQVANASREQDQAIRQITIGLSHINSAIDNNQDLAQQTSATANALKDNSDKLLHVVESLGL
jgi:methyl-accepting chemotaxis protein